MLYIISHRIGFRCFEDYCNNLMKKLKKTHDVKILIYSNQQEIPINNQNLYLFCAHIPSNFIDLWKTKQHQAIYLINTEQLSRKVFFNLIQSYIDMGITIIDYDLYQSQIYRSTSHIYLPYQYDIDEDKYLSSLILKTQKKFDVAFCSTNKSEKRKTIFDQLIKNGLSVIDVTGWKNQRDEKIASAKILVNIHYNSDYQIFEHFRCDRWILSGLLVISETSLSENLLDVKDLIISGKYENLVSIICNVIKNYESHYVDYKKKLSIYKENIINNRNQSFEYFYQKIFCL